MDLYVTTTTGERNFTALPEILDSGTNFDAPSEPREITKQGNFSPTSPVRKGEDSAYFER